MSATSREEPPDPRTAYKNIKGAFEDVYQLNVFPCFSDNDLMTCLLMKYGYSTVLAIAKTMQRVPDSIPNKQQKRICVKVGQCKFRICRRTV